MYEVAQMRENHGYPSPNKIPKPMPASTSCFSSFLCGMDVFADCCSAVSLHARDALDEACNAHVNGQSLRRAHEDWETVATLEGSDDSYTIRRTTSSCGVRRKQTFTRHNSFSAPKPSRIPDYTPVSATKKVLNTNRLPPRPDKR